ncbi:MAG: hypothetical protein VXA66_12570, partial [Alphaproteobacteria bacterium]
ARVVFVFVFVASRITDVDRGKCCASFASTELVFKKSQRRRVSQRATSSGRSRGERGGGKG